MKKILTILTASILCLSLVSCTSAGNSPEETAARESTEETSHDNSPEETSAADSSGELPAGELAADTSSEDIDYTTGTPWMYIDLAGNVTADTPTDLKDNYALWANKDRILSLEIPEGYISLSRVSPHSYPLSQIYNLRILKNIVIPINRIC